MSFVTKEIEGYKDSTIAEKLRAHSKSIVFNLLFFVLVGMIVYSISNSYEWRFDRLMPYIIEFNELGFTSGLFINALFITLKLVCMGLILAVFVGLILAIMNLSSSPVARLFAKSFIALIRNTPLLMQLYLVYFVFAPAFNFNNFTAALIALAFFEGAYMAEIFRAGFISVADTQWEAGFSLGFNTFEVGKIIILPQAVNNVLPSITGQLVSLIKDTSLVSTIAVADLTMRASEIIAETYLAFEVWLVVALVYLVLTSCVSIPSALYERRKNRARK